MKLLFIEDTFVFIKTMKRIADTMKFDLLIADKGQSALEMAEQDGPQLDLVICDIGLPDMSGIDVMKRLKVIIPAVPVVALTAKTLEEELKNLVIAGFDAYYTKPMEISEIMDLIRAYWPKGSAQ